MKKTILITGGAGFIGSNFVRYLFKKYPLCRLMILDSLTYAGDIERLKLELLRQVGFIALARFVNAVFVHEKLLSQSIQAALVPRPI